MLVVPPVKARLAHASAEDALNGVREAVEVRAAEPTAAARLRLAARLAAAQVGQPAIDPLIAAVPVARVVYGVPRVTQRRAVPRPTHHLLPSSSRRAIASATAAAV